MPHVITHIHRHNRSLKTAKKYAAGIKSTLEKIQATIDASGGGGRRADEDGPMFTLTTTFRSFLLRPEIQTILLAAYRSDTDKYERSALNVFLQFFGLFRSKDKRTIQVINAEAKEFPFQWGNLLSIELQDKVIALLK